MMNLCVTEITNKVFQEVEKKISKQHNVHRYWNQFSIIRFIHEKAGKRDYDADLVFRYEEKLKSEIKTRHEITAFRRFRRVAFMIAFYIKTGELSLKHVHAQKVSNLTPYYQELLDLFRSYLVWNRRNGEKRSARNISSLCATVYLFLEFIQKRHIEIAELNFMTINDYIHERSRLKYGLSGALYGIRHFVRYLCENNRISKDLEYSIPSLPKVSKFLMPVATSAEVQKLIDSVDTSTPIGKRDCAMFLLAASTGLRAGDLISMRLQDINWHTNEIRCVQNKTKIGIALPLDIQTGNAIADYILNARPKTESDKIFISVREPYQSMGSSIIRYRIMTVSPELETQGKGAHSIRRYVATGLLAESVNVSRIKEILGHTQGNSLRSYVRADKKGLLDCAIGLFGIEPMSEVYKWLK